LGAYGVERAVTTRLPKVRLQRYQQLDGSHKMLVQQVGNGSIVRRFDRTPIPVKKADVVCPHFMELKWAYGCPFDCAWCFLKGTLRLLETKTKPVVKDYSKIQTHLTSFFRNDGCSGELLNAGELADSLMAENTDNPFSRFVIPLFENQDLHKVLFLTKSVNIRNLEKTKHHEKVIVSFSLNAPSVARKWERAPPVEKRLNAAETLSRLHYETRVRIDPIVPIENWENEYLGLVDSIFSRFAPERITLGSLRGLRSTLNNVKDRSWVAFMDEGSNWGRKVGFGTRFTIYDTIIEYLKTEYNYSEVALCKETIEMWDELGMDYRKIHCNCLL